MITATYSPEDNKIRLYPSTRLDGETYAKVKAAGFKWAPKQELFVAPTWSPSREDLAIELAGTIDDEDTSLVERAEAKAERLEDLAERRVGEARATQAAVDRIADGIPMGQPILVGHHSEKRARKDAEKITNGMRKTVNLFKQAAYWASRADGALRLAKYKERPDVRARRIKKLESELRKFEKDKRDRAANLALWTKVKNDTDPERQKAAARAVANMCWLTLPLKEGDKEGWTTGPTAWGAINGEYPNLYAPRTVEEVIAYAIECYGQTARLERWIEHTENRLAYERAMLGEAGGLPTDQTKPVKGGAVRGAWFGRGGWLYVQKVNKVTVTLKYWPVRWASPRECLGKLAFDEIKGVMTPFEIQAAKNEGRLVEDEHGCGFHLIEKDAPPPAPPEPRPVDPVADELKAAEARAKAGVQVAVAPQLFPTPQDVAERMVRYAGIEPGDRVLEPSAGTGVLVQAATAAGARVTAIEVNQALAARLTGKAETVICADFLDAIPDPTNLKDAIVMNPPFENGADIKHIRQAMRFLKPGGRLVAICANGPRQAEAFKDMAEHWEELPAGTFAGTQVRAALMVIRA